MTQPPPSSTPCGLLIIDKPEGITSMGVCRRVRGALVAGGAPKRVKVGHGGTLDPLATGVLVILVGKATRLCDQIMAGQKRYLAEVDLSRTSTTDDREGEQHEVCCLRAPTIEEVRAACARFVGEIMQAPPAYSAIKVEGQRAYRLARAGAPPVLPPRPVRIDSIDVLGYEWPLATLDILCGKGTYIRSLARDLGGSLTGGGMLHSLRRTRVGKFTIDDAVPLSSVASRLRGDELRPV
ncbi:MAG: tRNA pseudouridine(55) synthase TruB [Phycisphaerales bacterium]